MTRNVIFTLFRHTSNIKKSSTSLYHEPFRSKYLHIPIWFMNGKNKMASISCNSVCDIPFQFLVRHIMLHVHCVFTVKIRKSVLCVSILTASSCEFIPKQFKGIQSFAHYTVDIYQGHVLQETKSDPSDYNYCYCLWTWLHIIVHSFGFSMLSISVTHRILTQGDIKCKWAN